MDIQPDESQPYSPPPPPPTGPEAPYAAWWRRAVAAGLDLIIVAAPVGVIGGMFGLVETVVAADGTEGYRAKPGLLLLSFLTTLAYYSLMDGSSRGATVGKMATRIQVRDATTGGPIGPGRALARRFVYLVLFNALIIPGLINILVPLWDRRRQAWHDKAANSVVVDAAG